MQEPRAGCGCLSALLIAGVAVWAAVEFGWPGMSIPLGLAILLAWLIRQTPAAGSRVPDSGSELDVEMERLLAREPLGRSRRPRSTARRVAVSRPGMGPTIYEGNEELRFIYVDPDGVVTQRSVRAWVEYDEHIRGYCLLAGASRTFRKDRIEAWLEGTDRFVLAP